jgi:hypothetical protein
MKQQSILIENLKPAVANLIAEDVGGKHSYLTGIFMQAELQNGNGRKYPQQEIANAVARINEQIKSGVTVYGELNHPANLQIDLNNVSHIITEMWMEGSDAYGKARIITGHPKGQIVKAIIDAGGALGVSSRGSGNVNEGTVSDFNLVTVDIVATPSAPNAFPKHVMEALGDNTKVQTLAEYAVQDPVAQKYLKAELMKFFDSIKK